MTLHQIQLRETEERRIMTRHNPPFLTLKLTLVEISYTSSTNAFQRTIPAPQDFQQTHAKTKLSMHAKH